MKKKVKKTTTDDKMTTKKTKKISSYDYRQWDKLDVVCGVFIGIKCVRPQ